jgi:hypothetical protein
VRLIIIPWFINDSYSSASGTTYVFDFTDIAHAKSAFGANFKRAAKYPHRCLNFGFLVTLKIFKPIDGKRLLIRF